MIYHAINKIAGGKLLRVKIEADEFISSINITGDFFLHPEDALPFVEKKLAGLRAHETGQYYARIISEALEEQGATFIGVTAADIAQTICEAFASG